MEQVVRRVESRGDPRYLLHKNGQRAGCDCVVARNEISGGHHAECFRPHPQAVWTIVDIAVAAKSSPRRGSIYDVRVRTPLEFFEYMPVHNLQRITPLNV